MQKAIVRGQSRPVFVAALAAMLMTNCTFGDNTTAPQGDDEFVDTGAADLPVGDIQMDDAADGNWDNALRCKEVPDLPKLTAPEIYISYNGLTLRLVDKATGFDKVFPVGPGALDNQVGSPTYGESLSWFPSRNGKRDFVIKPSTIQPCKIWLTDQETGTRTPVFAGLPFLSFSGNYAIHGPIDNYTRANGGTLRRGFVSHGCVRMEAADILEVYARIKGIANVPVHVQREPERDINRDRIDVDNKWIGAECEIDADCNYEGGTCNFNSYSGRGVCSAKCTFTCADRAGYPTTFCVADPNDNTSGMCVPKVVKENDCRSLDHFVPSLLPRFGNAAVKANVCVPGSAGFIGDQCLSPSDCDAGLTCLQTPGEEGAMVAGICTKSCTSTCPDLPNNATTMCGPSLDDDASNGECVRTCTPGNNAAECGIGSDCIEQASFAHPAKIRNVCVPRH